MIALDTELKQFKEKLLTASPAEKEELTKSITELEKQIKRRERALFGVYQQVAVHFADLHDTPGRMKAKGVIRKQVEWKYSRHYFYYRLKRRLLDFQAVNTILTATATSSTTTIETMAMTSQPASTLYDSSASYTKANVGFRKEMIESLKSYLMALSSPISHEEYQDDEKYLQWIHNHSQEYQEFIQSQIMKYIAKDLNKNLKEIAKVMINGSIDTGKQALLTSFASLNQEEKAAIMAALKEL